MSGVGIASFTENFFRSRDRQADIKARADAKKRQEKLDGWQEAREGRAAEEHGWRRDANGRVVSDYNRDRADDQAIRDASAAAYDATEASFGAPPLPNDPAEQPVSVSTSGQPAADPVAGVAAELGLGAPPRRAGTEAFIAARPPESFAQPGAAPVVARRADAVPAFELTGRGNQPVQQGQPPGPGPSFEQTGRGAPPVAPMPQPGSGPAFERVGRGDQPVREDMAPTAAAGPGPDFERLGRGAQPVATGAPPDMNRGRTVSIPGAGEEYLLHQNGRAYGISSGKEITDPSALAMIRERAYQAAPVEAAASLPIYGAPPPAATRTEDFPPSRAPMSPMDMAVQQQRQQQTQGPARQRPAFMDDPGYEAEQRRLAQERLDRDKPNYDHQFGSAGGLGGDIGEVARRGAAALDNTPAIAAKVAGVAANAVNGVINPWARYATGSDFGTVDLGGAKGAAETAAGALPLGAPPAAAPPGPAAGPTRAAAGALPPVPASVPASAPAPTKALAAVGSQAIAESSTPAMQAAGDAAAASMPPMGASGSRPVSKKQRERGSQAFLDRYAEVGVPIVVEAYLRTGQVEKAMKFQEFVEQADTKRALKSYAEAAFAVSVGDFDTFGDNMMDIYNDFDYFPDGTTVVKEQSGYVDAAGNIVTHKSGKAVGGILTFKDEKTGATFQQSFANMQDMVKAGAMLTPENAFEWIQQQGEAEAKAALGAKDDAKEAAKTRQARVDFYLTKILKMNEQIAGGSGITMEEARAQAEAQADAESGVAAADPLGLPAVPPNAGPPVARRP
ncbi:hypothetical protein [Cereibacter changlensis]|uniref:hypothetical protein n=1 Tax=Cereibacter changlensis TaxID=402884 RepID=UPI0040339DC8